MAISFDGDLQSQGTRVLEALQILELRRLRTLLPAYDSLVYRPFALDRSAGAERS